MSPLNSDCPPLFDHMARANGQTVHCERAAFFTSASIPLGTLDRIRLGFALGFGLICGISFAVLLATVASSLYKWVFA